MKKMSYNNDVKTFTNQNFVGKPIFEVLKPCVEKYFFKFKACFKFSSF